MLIATLLGVVSTVDDFMFFAVFVNQGAAILQTNWFMGSVLTELVFLFSIRTRLPFYKASRPSWICACDDGACRCSRPLSCPTPPSGRLHSTSFPHDHALGHHPWPGRERSSSALNW
ncbi:MAG: hypothetical protein M0C28_17285 [Candidatus Moduliflexus flocculans]|nr:hypothetical protein [Candidatus Moduliflexus flocculans]